VEASVATWNFWFIGGLYKQPVFMKSCTVYKRRKTAQGRKCKRDDDDKLHLISSHLISGFLYSLPPRITTQARRQSKRHVILPRATRGPVSSPGSMGSRLGKVGERERRQLILTSRVKCPLLPSSYIPLRLPGFRQHCLASLMNTSCLKHALFGFGL
jgi:hypothetical protein